MENYENNSVTSETEENPYGQDFANYQTTQMSKEEFMKNHESFNKTIKIVAIVSYVLIGLNALTIIINPLIIIDLVIFLGCTLGIHLKHSKACAYILLAYSIFGVVVGLMSGAGPAGLLWLVYAIIYLTQFGKVNREYNEMYGY